MADNDLSGIVPVPHALEDRAAAVAYAVGEFYTIANEWDCVPLEYPRTRWIDSRTIGVRGAVAWPAGVGSDG